MKMNKNEELKKIEVYASNNNVPIMLKDGIEYLCNYIKENNVKRILEIGTAIGYSAIKMALVNNDIEITTIERDEQRYNLALNNIKKFNLENRIKVILADAIDVSLTEKFDLIPEDNLAIYGALQLYLDFINLFIRLIEIFGKSRDN